MLFLINKFNIIQEFKINERSIKQSNLHNIARLSNMIGSFYLS